MMELHTWVLSFPIVEGNGAAWTKTFHEHGIFVTTFSMDRKLESVEQEKAAHQSEGRRKQVLHSHIFLCINVETWEEPNCKYG
jgi:hypothetical protein